MAKIGLLGSAFNPPHNGHFRLALEAIKCLKLNETWLIPTFHPAHKNPNLVLDYELRVAMLEQSIMGLKNLKINLSESELNSPSYTYNTICFLQKKFPEHEFIFIVGIDDFLALPSWHRGVELPELISLIIFNRANYDKKDIKNMIEKHFSLATKISLNKWQINSKFKTYIQYEEITCLDLKSSDLRSKWLNGDQLDFLVPKPVVTFLQNNALSTKKYWQNND